MKKAWVGLIIVAVYFLLFLQFPIDGELPGNSDTLLAIALTNLFNEVIGLFVRGLPLDTVMYPVKDFLAYGENCFGLGFIFTAFKFLLRSDHWSYFGFLVTIFSLNSYALFQLASQYTRNQISALSAAFVLPLSNFVLANIDDANVIFVFFPVMATVSMLKFLSDGSRDELKKALLFSGLQIWFGMYVFLFQCLALVIFSLTNAKRIKELVMLRETPGLASRFLLPVLPIVGLYLWNHYEAAVFSPYDVGVSRNLSSLTLTDFMNVLPGNRLYSSATNVFVNGGGVSPWYAVRRYSFPGILLPVLVGCGLVRIFREKRPARLSLLLVVVVFVALAFGKNLFDYDSIEILPFGRYFRVASRAYLFAFIPFTVYFALGLESVTAALTARLKSRLALIVPIVATLVFVLENVPFPLPSYDYNETLVPPRSYVAFFERFPERQIVVDFPSTYLAWLPQDGPLWSYSRDALYMNWQTYHRQIIVGGINGYVPRVRVDVQKVLDWLPDPRAVENLLKLGARYLVFHKKFPLQDQERVLEKFMAADSMKLEFEDEDLAIFELKGPL